MQLAAPIIRAQRRQNGAAPALHATKPPPEENDEAPRIHSVFVEPVRTVDARLDVSTQGEVRPRTEVDIVAQVAGRVVAVSPEFTEGGRVTPGAALVTIEDTDHRLALGEARAAVADADLASSRPMPPQTSPVRSSATSRTRRRSPCTNRRSPRRTRSSTPPAIASPRPSSISNAPASRCPSTAG